MTTMIGQMLGLQQKKNTELLEEWDGLLDRRFRIRGELADSLSARDLIKLFHRHGNLQADELQAFAIALNERALISRDVDLVNEQQLPNAPDPEETESIYIERIMKIYVLLLTAQLHGSDRAMLNVDRTMKDIGYKLTEYHLEDELLELEWQWHA